MQLEKNNVLEIESGTCELVNGQYSPEEAAEILHDLFQKKISFHEIKSFSQLIQTGEKDPKTLKRINELQLDQKHAQEIIEVAKKAGKSLRVKSTIVIELV